MSITEVGNLIGSQIYPGFVDSTDPFDLYKFSLSGVGTFNASINDMTNNADLQFLSSSGEVLSLSTNLSTTPEAIDVANLAAGNYAVRVSQVSGNTGYNLNLTVDTALKTSDTNSQVDFITGQKIESGYFTVDETGEVNLEFAYDGGLYKGELAAFNLEGMEDFVLGSPEFTFEAARRSLSNSLLGYVIFSDAGEDAKFSGGLLDANYNDSQYKGIKTFAMKPGGDYGFMLIPHGTVQQVLHNPNLSDLNRPLFSLIPASQPPGAGISIADINGAGNAIAFEDLLVGRWADKDYNDLIVKMTGAKLTAPSLNQLINPLKDWRNSDGGKQLIDYLKTACITRPELAQMNKDLPKIPDFSEKSGILAPG